MHLWYSGVEGFCMGCVTVEWDQVRKVVSTIFLASEKGMSWVYFIFRISFSLFHAAQSLELAKWSPLQLAHLNCLQVDFKWSELSSSHFLHIFFLVHRLSWHPNFWQLLQQRDWEHKCQPSLSCTQFQI